MGKADGDEMNELFRIADLQDCIGIEKEKYVKAKKELERSSNEILRCYEGIIRLHHKIVEVKQ